MYAYSLTAMLSPTKLSKVRIITTARHKEDLIKSLYSFGFIQVSASENGEFDKPLDRHAAVSPALVHMRSLAKIYGLGEPARQPETMEDFDSVMADYAKFHETLSSYEEKIENAGKPVKAPKDASPLQAS